MYIKVINSLTWTTIIRRKSCPNSSHVTRLRQLWRRRHTGEYSGKLAGNAPSRQQGLSCVTGVRLRRLYFMSQMVFFFAKENFCTSDRYCCAFCSWAQLENFFVQCRQDFPSKACEGTSRLRPIFTSSPPNLSSRFPQWIDF